MPINSTNTMMYTFMNPQTLMFMLLPTCATLQVRMREDPGSVVDLPDPTDAQNDVHLAGDPHRVCQSGDHWETHSSDPLNHILCFCDQCNPGL